MEKNTLDYHLSQVKEGNRRFENAFQSISRMILEEPGSIERVMDKGRNIYDYGIFRKGKKHLVGMYDELNSFVNYVKGAAEGGSASEMAFVLVGEPGNGKTFFVDYLCTAYRRFLARDENRRYTFRFNGLNNLKKPINDADIKNIIEKYDKIAELTKKHKHLSITPEQMGKQMLNEINSAEINNYGKIPFIESQTYEDPMILAMNLYGPGEEGKAALSKAGFSDKQIMEFYKNYRPLGACTSYILNDIREHINGNIGELKRFIEVVPVSLDETLGTVTGKYAAKDKITSSSVDLLGEESIERLMNLHDTNNPYKFDLRRGAIARVAGGGIHFSDEIFRNKKDLVQVYLGVIQNRAIEIDGYKWPIDTLIVATSNNSVFNEFLTEDREAPIVDRCRICYVGHNTNYKLQGELTSYAIGDEIKKTIMQNDLHVDPNLKDAASVAAALTRLPRTDKLTPIEMMQLAAGETAGEKGIKTLIEVVDQLTFEADVRKRFGQKGLGHRNLCRSIQLLSETLETNERSCMFAYDVFKSLEKVILDYVPDGTDRKKYLEDLKPAKNFYRKMIRVSIFNAYMNEPQAVKKDVMNYVNMVLGSIDRERIGPDKMVAYFDKETQKLKSFKIDEKYMNGIEERLGLSTKEQKESHRATIIQIYGQAKVTGVDDYDFMDNTPLVKAVTDLRLESDIGTEGSLIGALANRTNEENQKIYDRMMKTMITKLNYCTSCAEQTIRYFCEKKDES